MIPVILSGGQKRDNGRKHFGFNPVAFQFPGIVVGQQQNGAHAVIHHSDLHSRLYFFFQYLQHSIPHMPSCHNKILEKNKLLRLSQLDQQIRKFILPERIIYRRSVMIRRKACAVFHIMGKSLKLR